MVVDSFGASTSSTTPVSSYHATALAAIKPRKHQRLTDPLLQFVRIMFSVL